MDIISTNYNHKEYRKIFESLMNDSINYLFDFIGLKRTNYRLNWKVCAAHYLASKYAELNNRKKVIEYLNYINSFSETSHVLQTLPLSSQPNNIEKDMIIEIINDDQQLRFGYCDDKSLTEGESQKIQEALALLKDNYFCASNEAEAYIDEIYLTREAKSNARFMRSGTNFYMWGLILLYVNQSNTIPYYIEHIVHECGHTALNIIHAEDRLVLNLEHERYDAPLRNDPRPIIGLFHALFILNRICEVFTVLQTSLIHDDYKHEINFRLNAAREKLIQTQKVLKTHAEFTEKGYEIFLSISKKWKI